MKAARREFPASVKKAAWARSDGRCENCCCFIQPGRGPEYHHLLDDELGGEPTLDNCAVWCVACHKAHHVERAATMAKVRRLEKAAANIRPKHKHTIPGSKASGFKKRLDGTVVRRPK